MVKITTNVLKEIVGKLSKINPNKHLEITRYFDITLNTDGLSGTAYDGNNFIVAKTDKVKAKNKKESFSIIVNGEQFTKLVNKTTVEEIKLEPKENYLEVKGNGTYKVELVPDEKYPSFNAEDPDALVGEVKVADIKKMIEVNKYSVSTNATEGYLNGYMLSKGKAITSDAIKVGIVPLPLGDELEKEDILLTKEMVNLLSCLDTPSVTMYYLSGKIMFESDNVIIYGAELEGKDEYPTEAILAFGDTAFDSSCVLSKVAVLSVLDRLTLFLDNFKKNEVFIDIDDTGVTISTASESYECISFVEAKNIQDFSCMVSSVFFKDQISAVQSDNFVLKFGEDNVISIVDNDIIQILATNEDEEEGEE